MKKLSSCLFIILFALVFVSCEQNKPIRFYKYYSIKNGLNNEVVIKFYLRNLDGNPSVEPTYTLQPGENSEIFEELIVKYPNKAPSDSRIIYTEPIMPINFFVASRDSIDIYVNNVLVKRYKRSESYPKSPYNKGSYDTVVKDKEGRDINVYTILNSDFE